MALIGWGIMWVLLLAENALLSLVALPLPVIAYYALFFRFRTAFMPFLVHVTGIAGFVASLFLFEAELGESAYEAIMQLTGNK